MAYALVGTSASAHRVPKGVATQAVVVALLLAVALVTRGLWLGDPTIGGDEQFYLLVADRMWQGALPYVDIWDRKPIGLFLIYAALRPLSYDGILAYQIGALLSATATALVVTRLASRIASLSAATAAGCLYLVMLPVFGGVGGQSPVFYNLLVACAGLLVVKAGECVDQRRAAGLACAAMALAGLAIQVKYTSLVEGAAFGACLVVTRWHRGRAPLALAGDAALWIVIAIAPTLAATVSYAALGHLDAFVYANFTSIFLKHAPVSEVGNIASNAVIIGPMLLSAAAASGIAAWRGRFSAVMLFLSIWVLAAFGGFFLIGHFYTHYLLPTLVPLSIVCAVLLENVVGLAIVFAPPLLLYVTTTEFPSRDRMIADETRITQLTATLAPYTRHGCVYLAEGPTITYLLLQSCLPSRYTFTEHLTKASESRAIDQPRGLADVLAHRPPAITLRSHRDTVYLNHEVDAALRAALTRDYRFKTRIAAYKADDDLDVYVRRDLP